MIQHWHLRERAHGIKPLFAKGPYTGLRMLFFVVLAIALMVMDQHSHYFKRVREALSVAIVPLEYLVSAPVRLVDRIQHSIVSNQALLAQNAGLQAKVLLLQAKLQKVLALEKENASLRALLQSSPRPSERLLVAQLLAVNPDPFVHQVVLNKGKKEGVYVGQPVLDANGVIGQVIAVDKYTSRILLLTDTRSAIPVQDSRNGLRGIVVGAGNTGVLSLIHMPATADIHVGDLLVTSGLGQRFPLGYPVGIVVSIKNSSGQQFAEIAVKPSAHIHRSRLVLLVWPGYKYAENNK